MQTLALLNARIFKQYCLFFRINGRSAVYARQIRKTQILRQFFVDKTFNNLSDSTEP